jgi:hypothetical protein
MSETPALLRLSFDDAGTFARALTQAEVSCSQTSAGPILLNLSICKSRRIELHFTSMPVGSCVAMGKSATGTQSFHIPLGNSALISMAGRQMDEVSFGAYTSGGEHVICARSGGEARLAYIVPSPELIQESSFARLGHNATETKASFDVVAADPERMARLRDFLHEVTNLIEDTPQALSNHEVLRNIEQVLMGRLLAAQSSNEQQNAAIGRAPVSRCRTMSKIDEFLRLNALDPVFDVFDMNPKRYLQLRRLHLAREKLLHDADPARSVSSVAFDCGFWQLGRFGQAYRELFGERPSQTLRRSRKAPDGQGLAY